MAAQPDAVDGDLPSDGSDVSSDQEELREGTCGSDTCSVVSFESFASGTLSFEIVRTRLAGKLKRYVVYVVRVRHSKESECEETTVERRYSDFEQLHGRLTALHPTVMSELVFPKKLWAGNFSAENIARRCQMFEQYLMHLCDLPTVVCSRPFCEFFYVPELQRHLAGLMRAPPPPEVANGDSGRRGSIDVSRAPGSPAAASSPTVRGLRSCLLMQLKLRCFVSSENSVLCAAGLVVAHLDAGDAVASYSYAMQLIAALSLPDRMPRNTRRPLFGPLADLAAELSLTLCTDSSSSGGVLASHNAQANEQASRDPSIATIAASSNKTGRRPSATAGLAVLHQTLRNALRMASTAADSWAP